MSQSLSGSLEELVLTGLVWDTKLASTIVLKVTPDLFTTRHYRTIAKAAIDHVIRYGEAPRNHLADILEEDINRSETGKPLWQAITRLGDIQAEMQPSYVLDELTNFIEARRLSKAIAQAADHLHKGDLSRAKESLHFIEPAEQGNPGIWMNDPAQAFLFLDREEEDDMFSLGIEALDSRGVRPRRKTLLILMAPKKRGKSMGLIQIAREAAFINRQKVLYVSLEMSDEEVAQRFVQSICGWTEGEWNNRTIRIPIFKRDTDGNYLGIDFDVLTPQVLNRGTRKDAVEKLRKVTRGNRRLLIKEFPTSQLSTQQLVVYLDYLKKVENWEPDMLVVDYANLMSMNAAQLRFETGRVFRELRGIGVQRNMAVVTATQGNRSSENARIVGSTHVSEDWSSMGTADIVLTICRTPEEHEKRLARIYVAAARRVPDQYLVMISQNYECCQFATDSIYMNKVADRDFQRMMESEDDD